MNRKLQIFIGAFIAILLVAGSFSGGLVVGWVLPHGGTALLPGQASNSSTNSATPADLQNLFKPFWETWKLVHDKYVDQPVDDTLLMQGAIRGMLDALKDPHTGYMSPDEYKQANAPLEGSYEGIGAWVDITGKLVKIISPMPGSPAEKAGLKANDQVLKVDGTDMTGVDGSLVLRKIQGAAGSNVTLTILREGQDPFEVTLARAKIVIPSVESKMLDNDIAYVRLTTFGDKSGDDLKAALKELMAKKPKGLILDLRNNGGGFLNTAIDVVSQFVGKGVVMYEQYGDGHRDTFSAKPGGLATNIPLVVLVNEGTASASEITAGAIQDYARGKLVGMTTYGKGSVQTWEPLQNAQGAVRVTVARWLTPKDRQINGKGLIPDLEVKITEEDVKAGRDPQLDKAIQILLGN